MHCQENNSTRHSSLTSIWRRIRIASNPFRQNMRRHYLPRLDIKLIAKHKLDGYKDGAMGSYYFYPVSNFVLLHSEFFLITETEPGVIYNFIVYFGQDERVNQMKQYMPVKKAM